MEKEGLVVVMTFNRVNDAELYKALLESAGVRAVLQNALSASMMPVGGLIDIRLAVAAEDEKKAREVLSADFDKTEYAKELK